MMNSDHPIDEQSDSSIERLLADCDEALIRGEDPTPLLRRLDAFPPEAREEFQEVYESLITVRGALSAKQPSSRFPRPFGKFRLLKVLGQGGFGLVLLAEDPELRRRVALKVPRLHQLVAPNAEERFLREAQMAAELEHPHLVSIYESGEAEGLPYLASAYCEGPTLAHWLNERGELLSIRESAELVELLAQAASHMHERRIVHRDLKPSNVLLFPRERKKSTAEPEKFSKQLGDYVPKITDFGLAKPHDLVNDLSRTGIFLGTAAYVSPEQAWGKRESVGPSTDIYSLGVILYELLTGHPPFRGDNELDTLRQASSQEPFPPRNLRRETPRDLETICLKCLEKEPEKRYASMADLGEDLRRFLTDRPILAKPTGYIDKTSKLIKRQPWLTGLAGLAIVLMIAVAIGSYRAGRRGNNPGNPATDTGESNRATEDAIDHDAIARSFLYATRIQGTSQFRSQRQLKELKEVLSTLVPKSGRPDPRSFEWYYLNNVSKGIIFTELLPFAYCVSPDSKWCAVAGEDNLIRIIEISTGYTKHTLGGFVNRVHSLRFLKDSSRLISLDFGNRDGEGHRGEFKFWDARQNFEMIKTISYEHLHHPLFIPFFSLASESDTLFVLDHDNDHRLQKIDLAEALVTSYPSDSRKDHVASSSRGDRIVLKRPDGLEIWDAREMKRLKDGFGSHQSWVAAFSPDGLRLAYSLRENLTKYFIEVRDLSANTTFQTFTVDNFPDRIAFDQGSNLLAVRTDNRSYRLFDIRSGKLLNRTSDPLALGGIDLLGEEEGIEIAVDNHRFKVPNQKIQPADSYLPPPLPESEAWCAAFAPAGDMLAVGYDHEPGDNRETLKLWDPKSRKAVNLAGHSSIVMAVAFSPDGDLLASAGYDETIRIWNVKTGKEIRILIGHAARVRAVAFHPDSRTLVSGDNKGIIKLWDCADGTEIASWKAHPGQSRAVAFLLDGKFIVSGGNYNPIRIWRTSDQALVTSLGENTEVQGLAISPDGALLASAHQNHTVQLWDLQEDKLLKTIRNHTDKVRCVAFSPDGKTLVSGGEDKVIRFWNVASGIETMTIPVDHFVNGLSFDAKGRTLIAALHNGVIKVFNGAE